MSEIKSSNNLLLLLYQSSIIVGLIQIYLPNKVPLNWGIKKWNTLPRVTGLKRSRKNSNPGLKLYSKHCWLLLSPFQKIPNVVLSEVQHTHIKIILGQIWCSPSLACDCLMHGHVVHNSSQREKVKSAEASGKSSVPDLLPPHSTVRV